VYDFTVDVPGSGGPYINCGGTNSDCNEESYWQVGNAVTLYAEPASGNVFAGWEGCATVAAGKGLPNGRCDFQIAASTVISARFLVDRPAPVINEFNASPAQVAPLGTPVVLSWDIAYSGTDFSLEITDDQNNTYDTTGKGLTDSLAVGTFDAARTFTLTVTTEFFGEDTAQDSIAVGDGPRVTFGADDTTITADGPPTTLRWNVENADTVTIAVNGGTPAPVDLVGSRPESPDETTEYVLTATKTGFPPVTEREEIVVGTVPTIVSFNSNPPATATPPRVVSVEQGDTVTLDWEVTGASPNGVITLNGTVVSANPATPFTVPTDTVSTEGTVYTLAARNAFGDATPQSIRVIVNAAPPPPAPDITSFTAPGTPEDTSYALGTTIPLTWAITNQSTLTALTLTRIAPAQTINIPGSITTATTANVELPGTEGTFTYRLTATNDVPTPDLSDVAEKEIVVGLEPVIGTISVTENTPDPGDYTISWSPTGTGPISYSYTPPGGGDSVTVSGTPFVLTNPAPGTYTLNASNAYGPSANEPGTDSSSFVIPEPTPPPVISNFNANDKSVFPGTTINLFWSVTGAQTLSINQGVGSVTGLDGKEVTVGGNDTTYTLTATNAEGVSDTEDVTITVSDIAITFSASPTEIVRGESSTLTWDVVGEGSVSVAIDPGVIGSGAQGTEDVFPTQDTTYTLTASNDFGTRTATATVVVNDPPRPEPAIITDFSASPTTIDPGGSSTLSWTVVGTEPITVTISDGVSDIFSNTGNGSGTLPVTPSATMTYTLSASNGVNPDPAPVSVQVTVNPPAAPVINSFEANPEEILTGESSTLTWDVSGEGLSVEIDNAVGAVSPQGSASVSPPDDTTYTLTASNGGGTRTATATIVVNDPPPVPPVINSFTANPTEIVAGGSSTLQWEVTGSEPLAVNLDNGIGAVEAVSSLEVSPDTTTSYTLTASNTAGNISNTVTLTVTIPDEPASVVSFAADPATIELGDSSTLTWSATGTLPLEISLFENGVLLADGLDVSGSFPVTPTSEGSYSYTLTAGNEAGSDSAESEVTVLLPDDGGDDEDEG
jgi:hypothetical protein